MTLEFQARLQLAQAKKAKKREKAKRLKLRKPTLTSLKKKLWALIAPMIRERYGPRCFTCVGKGTQTGHMFPKGRAHAVSAFMPDNLRPQCFYCNINLGGNGAEFAIRYTLKYGQARFDRVAVASTIYHKWTCPEVQDLISAARLGLDVYSEAYEKALLTELQSRE